MFSVRQVVAPDLLANFNRNVMSIDDYASCFENIDPLLPYKKWRTKQVGYENSTSQEIGLRYNVYSQKVQAVFIVSDSIDWSRDIQVGPHPHFFFAGTFRLVLNV